MELFEAIAKRHSYRGSFHSDSIPREDLRRIAEAGLSAPSGCNLQTTSLVILDDPALVASVGGLLKKPHFASAPAAICVLTQSLSNDQNRRFNVQDYAAAIENMLLATTALGYASCWVEGYVTSNLAMSAEMAKRLRVPDGYSLVAYLPIGIPVEDGSSAERQPFEARAWFNAFGK